LGGGAKYNGSMETGCRYWWSHFGFRISDFGLNARIRNPQSAIRNYRGTSGGIIVFAATFLLLPICSTTLAQVADEKPTAEADRVTYGEPSTIRFRVGAEATAKNGPARDVRLMVAVPLECPEQSVKAVDEDFTSEIGNVDYRMVQGGARQMLITIPRIADGAKAHAIVTFEVSTRPILPPETTDDLKIPEHPPAGVRQFLLGSPYIEVQHHAIKSLAKEIMGGVDTSATDWHKVEALYDWVLEHIQYVEGDDKTAVETLHDKQADCEGRSALFIALCRASKVPARMVWVDGHAYAEFYMDNDKGEGAWYPAESAGTRAFGEMPLARTILQKGDNFRVPERKEHLRYASNYGSSSPAGGSEKPSVRFIQEQLGK
jgi:Transglutaminase-like superfamily